MAADWELDGEAEKIGDERRWTDAQLAAMAMNVIMQ